VASSSCEWLGMNILHALQAAALHADAQHHTGCSWITQSTLELPAGSMTVMTLSSNPHHLPYCVSNVMMICHAIE